MRITLGVGGGIAAYKAAELVRRLQERGFEVQVVMTKSACQFITPLTLASLSGRKVITDLFEIESAIEHIAVAQATDLLLIAPATADLLAKMAHGLADDFLTTMHLATQAPIVIAPSMNVNMWNHPATQENLATLRSRGARVIAPGEGYLACGMVGAGRLAEVDAIVAAVVESFEPKTLSGQTVLITAGPTQEEIDPVRYITNRSSGRMGYALAEVAARRGARTILVSGPTALAAPAGVEMVAVRSAAEMTDAVMSRMDGASVVIMAAAVADYRPAQRASQKIKKQNAALTIELESTTDILKQIAQRKRSQYVVGFAAETENLVANASQKLERKNLDLIVANDVSGTETGFDSEFNVATLISADGEVRELPKMTKHEMAARIFDTIVLRTVTTQ